jgi:hypothetical protein
MKKNPEKIVDLEQQYCPCICGVGVFCSFPFSLLFPFYYHFPFQRRSGENLSSLNSKKPLKKGRTVSADIFCAEITAGKSQRIKEITTAVEKSKHEF